MLAFSQRLNTFMNCSNTPREVLIPIPGHREPGIDNHIPELLLAGEPLYALNKILVRIPVTGNNLADERDRAERPALVERIEKYVVHGAEFETRKDTTGFQHAMRLAQGSGDIGEITNAERNGVEVDGVIGDSGWQGGGVRLKEGKSGLVGDREVLGARAPNSKHGGVDVRNSHVHRGVSVRVDGVAEEAEGNVAGTSGNIKEAKVRRGVRGN